MAHSNRSRGLQFPRRQTGWDEGPQGNTTISSITSTIFTTGAQANIAGLTIVRLHGELLLTLNFVASALDGFFRCAFGICIVTENAFNAGAGSVPAPVADVDWEGWMVHQFFSIRAISATLGNTEGPANFRMKIDSKSMRKVRISDVVVGVVECTNETGTTVMGASLTSRMLSKLP